MPTTKQIGDFGENAVCDFLLKKGYEILFRNFHSRYGEIDIIAKDSNTIVFVEVKTRKNSDYGNACEFVNYHKQKKMIMTAKYFLQKDVNAPARFDVCEVYYSFFEEKFTVKSINHIENAFQC